MNFFNKRYLRKKSEKVREEDTSRLAGLTGELKKRFEKSPAYSKVRDDFLFVIQLLKDYTSGSYRAIPWRSIAAITFTLLYILNPMDFIPDLLPLTGLVDDGMLFATLLKLIKDDLDTYRQWKLNQQQG